MSRVKTAWLLAIALVAALGQTIFAAGLAAFALAMAPVFEKPESARVGWWNFNRRTRRDLFHVRLSTKLRALYLLMLAQVRGLSAAFAQLGALFAGGLRFANSERGSLTIGYDLRDLHAERNKLIAAGRAITERGAEEKREMTAEESANFDKIYGTGGAITDDLAAEERSKRLGDLGIINERIEQVGRQLAGERTIAGENAPGAGGAGAGDPAAEKRAGVIPAAVAEWQAKRSGEFRSFLSDDQSNGKHRFELRHLSEEEQAEIRTAIAALPPTEQRALQADADILGGNTVQAEQFVPRLLQAVDEQLHIRQAATIFRVENADSLGIPSLDTDPDDADWTVELGTGSEDSAMRFGKRELKPHPLAKRIKVSKTLLRKSVMPIENIVLERLAYKKGVTEEKGFLTGTGANQPLGVFTASNDGIPTGRDVSTGNTTTSITGDGLIEAKYFLKAQYWPRAQWFFHRDAVKQIAKLKDGDGQYIWQPGLQAGQPDRLLSFPMRVSEYAPNTFTTGLYVGLLGDFSFYWIADALSMELQKLVELYSETNQTGFILRAETDGMPVLGEAFARVKLA